MRKENKNILNKVFSVDSFAGNRMMNADLKRNLERLI
jgi:hypothetical protein